MKPVVVFPSNREVDTSILDSLPDTDIAIVEAPGFSPPPRDERIHVLSMIQQQADFGTDTDLLGYGSAAVRNYGVWWAYQNDYDLVINLDDDCWPEEGLVESYQQILTKGVEAIPLHSTSGWVSTLHQEGMNKAWYPRGFPYEERLAGHRQSEAERATFQPVVHMGLWRGTLDLNAVDKVAYADSSITLSEHMYVTQDHVPICAMNFACLREWMPFIYQVPWTRFGTTLPLSRYDDIVGGVITAALARLEDAYIGFGPPFVDHRKKDGDLLAHAAAENLGNVLISRLASRVDAEVEQMRGAPPGSRHDRAQRLLAGLQRSCGDTQLSDLVNHVSSMYLRWLRWFE